MIQFIAHNFEPILGVALLVLFIFLAGIDSRKRRKEKQ
jgi:hypothetical protein